MSFRLAIVTTHPIQYYAPWFRHLATAPGLSIKVFYLWDSGVTEKKDAGFGQSFKWDVPLLDGYAHEFVPNASPTPGTSHFNGINNPTLADRLREWNPGAVFMMAFNYRGLIPFIFTWTRTPLIFRGDSHRIVPPTGLKATLKKFVASRIFARFSACLYVGHANREYFRIHGVPDHRLFPSPHCVDNGRFMGAREPLTRKAAEWRAENRIDDQSAVFLFAGKFQMKKRPDLLLKAFLRAAQAITPSPMLLMVGAGEMEAQLLEAADESSSVRFMPFQNQSAMPGVLALADVVVLPSQGSGETWGLIINEAQCLGKAVIVSDHVGCAADLVESHDGDAPGIVVRAGDADSLAKAIGDLAADRPRCLAMGEAGLRRIGHYNYAQATEGLLRALASCTSFREATP